MYKCTKHKTYLRCPNFTRSELVFVFHPPMNWLTGQASHERLILPLLVIQDSRNPWFLQHLGQLRGSFIIKRFGRIWLNNGRFNNGRLDNEGLAFGTMLISMASVFVLSAWLWLENWWKLLVGHWKESVQSLRWNRYLEWQLEQQGTVFFFGQRSLHLFIWFGRTITGSGRDWLSAP